MNVYKKGEIAVLIDKFRMSGKHNPVKMQTKKSRREFIVVVSLEVTTTIISVD